MTTAEVLTQTLYADNTEEFITLVNGLAEEGTANSVGVLLSTFVDDFDYYDEMSVVMHAIERVNADVVGRRLGEAKRNGARLVRGIGETPSSRAGKRRRWWFQRVWVC